ncbi:transmembrane protein 71 isoform X2 [Panthera onca]|uniref:transmembrane protein 71 isoform X2 n=1 Tax=Panthera onca TaxID=9690 RepID=UPI002953A60F|nr:transmembrane protein 71 isoform X2 [Panthera onca]XP_060467359.1 transmembrane protein 71 isoform X2 [Panthera onca]XP_060467360.1 transmembrane protein 71 isoform X2 [Panthera onca]
MYRISQLMSTPVASSSGSERRYTGEPSPRCLFPSFACDFLDGDSSFEGCSAALLTGSHVTCRRSPRLLSNGYYVWTEDPLLCDKDGNITLSPPQASVLYKENLVRIFRKKKRIRPSFSDLFSLGASKSWQHGNIFGDVDSSLNEDTWLEGVGRLDMHHCDDIGDDHDGSATDAREAEQRKAASSSSHAASRTPPENSHDLALQSPGTTSEHFPGNLLDHAKTSLWRDIFFQALLLATCLIICACARCFLGGIFARVLTCPLMITTAHTVTSLFLSLADCFEATTCAQFAKICQPCRTVSDG